MEAEKSKIKVLADSVSGEDSVPGLQIAVSLFCSHMAFLGACTLGWGWGERDPVSFSFYKGINPIMRAHPHGLI